MKKIQSKSNFSQCSVQKSFAQQKELQNKFDVIKNKIQSALNLTKPKKLVLKKLSATKKKIGHNYKFQEIKKRNFPRRKGVERIIEIEQNFSHSFTP